MEGNEIKDAAGTVLDLILQQGRERKKRGQNVPESV